MEQENKENNEKKEYKDPYQEEKAKKEFLIFDRGLSELTVSDNKDKKNKRHINWFILYKILFKNILNSKDVIPLDELILRFNIIRTSLPKYYKGYKGNDSNSSAIIKKFTYHICKSKKKNKSLFKLKKNNEENNNDFIPINKLKSDGNISFRSRSFHRTKTVKLSNKLNLELLNNNKHKNSLNLNNNILRKKLNEGLETLVEKGDVSFEGNRNPNFESLSNFQIKNKNLLINNNKSPKKASNNNINSYTNSNKKDIKNKNRINLNFGNSNAIKFNNVINFNKDNKKNEKKEGNEIVLGTPTDSEFPLVLSQKRSYNTKPSFFFESLNKIKELTKQEKIKTYQKEFASQILKFNDLYFDPKIDDFYNDKLFNDVKATCDLFINKFTIDSEEEKNLADLDNYI